MHESKQENFDVVKIIRDNEGLKTTVDSLRSENGKLSDKVMHLWVLLVVVVIVMGFGWGIADSDLQDARDEICELESDMGELKKERNELEDACFYFEDYVEFLEGELESYGYWEELAGEETTESSSEEVITVYITETGERYHKDGCQYLSESQIPIDIKDASYYGYTPCSRCY